MEWGFTMNFNLSARIMNLDIWKSYNVHSGEETNIRDPRSYEHYWTSSWNNTWKKFRHVRDCEHMTSAIPALYQLSWQANWELVIMLGPNKPSKWWITIIDDCRYMKIIYANHICALRWRNEYKPTIIISETFLPKQHSNQDFLIHQHSQIKMHK